jgi:hypothetical protein
MPQAKSFTCVPMSIYPVAWNVRVPGYRRGGVSLVAGQPFLGIPRQCHPASGTQFNVAGRLIVPAVNPCHCADGANLADVRPINTAIVTRKALQMALQQLSQRGSKNTTKSF